MIRYYKLFDLLNRSGMKKSDLRKILSSSTVAKLSKGQYISGEAIEKICLFIGCQPGDIMEIVEETDTIEKNTGEVAKIIEKHTVELVGEEAIPFTDTYIKLPGDEEGEETLIDHENR